MVRELHFLYLYGLIICLKSVTTVGWWGIEEGIGGQMVEGGGTKGCWRHGLEEGINGGKDNGGRHKVEWGELRWRFSVRGAFEAVLCERKNCKPNILFLRQLKCKKLDDYWSNFRSFDFFYVSKGLVWITRSLTYSPTLILLPIIQLKPWRPSFWGSPSWAPQNKSLESHKVLVKEPL